MYDNWKYCVVVLLCLVAQVARPQDLRVLDIFDDSYPKIRVRARVLASVDDSVKILENDLLVPCRVAESGDGTADRDGKMHVFLVENSYYMQHNGVFPQMKKALLSMADYLCNADNANILYFVPQEHRMRFISAEQTQDLKMLCEIADCHLLPQCDSSATGIFLPEAIGEALKYCVAHRKNHETVVLTLISRGLNTGPSRHFSDELARMAQDNGIYLNILMYDSESQNVKRELQELAAATEGSFVTFSAGDVEPALAQSLEKMGKAKYKEYFKELVVSFDATQSGLSNSFTVNYGNTSVLCEYGNLGKGGLVGKYPFVILLLVILALAIAAIIVFRRYRMRIIRRINSHTQSRVDEIKRQNRILKQEIEKYKRHPLSMAHKFDNVYVEEALIGAGKIVPKFVAMDGDRQQVLDINKLTMTIGRSGACDIVLDNRTVSGTHATLTNEGGIFYIADNGSTNGIFVNDIRITKSKVSSGDRIRIGAVLAKIVY